MYYSTLKAHDVTFKLHAHGYVFDKGYVTKSWLWAERDLSIGSCWGNFEGAIEEKASLTIGKAP